MRRLGVIETGIWVLFLGALLFGIYSQVAVKQRSPAFLEDAAGRFGRLLDVEAKHFANWQALARSSPHRSFEAWQQEANRLGIRKLLYVHKGDSLIYWNSNRIDVEELRTFSPGFQTFGNLIAYVFKEEIENITHTYLVPLRDNYSIENRYLKNAYTLKFDGIEQLRLLPVSERGQVVRLEDGQAAFKLVLRSNQRYVNRGSYERFSAISFLIAIIASILLFFFRIQLEQVKRKPWVSLLEFSIPLVVIRLLLFVYRNEIGLSALEGFDPNIFASHWLLPSFGDLLMHLLGIALILLFGFRYRHLYHIALLKIGWRYKNWLFVWLVSMLGVLFFLVSLLISRDLVFSSNIPLGLEKLFDYNGYTYLAFATYLLLISINAAHFYLLYKYVWRNIKSWHLLVIYLLIMLFVIWVFSLTGERVWLSQYRLWWVFLGLIILAIRLLNLRFKHTFLVLLSCWSMFVGYQVSEALYRKQIEMARYTAQKIYSPNDATAIYLLLDLIPKIQQEPALTSYGADSEDLSLLNKRLVYDYFKGYLDKYALSDLQLKVGIQFDTTDFQSIRDELEQLNRFSMLRQFKQNARQGYSLRLPFLSDLGRVDTLTLRIVQKSLKPDSPLPNLLLEGDLVKRETFSSFSFALYEDSRLIQQAGRYPYQLNDDIWRQLPGDFAQMQIDGLSHLIYRPDNASTVVVSFVSGGWLRTLAAASGLLLFSIGLLLIANRFVSRGSSWKGFTHLSYRNRIEVALIGSVFIIMLVIGYITVTYSVIRSKANTEELITNRLQDIQAAVESMFRLRSGGLRIDANQRLELNQIATRLEADFSLYDLQGKLLFSSQGKLYEQELLGEYAHPNAFYQLAGLQRTVFLQSEHLGDFHFQSVYLPLRDSRSDLMGIVNMPAFDKDLTEKSELNTFIGNLISIYLVMLLVAGFLVFWLAERITSPIQLITGVIMRTKGGMRDQMPDWKREDEIGLLISSYNEMLQELDQSARLLARSERESAWREMARQIAHEIRNPLTPMKLKLQRMLRDFNENPERFETRFKDETGLVLEQIDVLAAVAGEFSSFAQVQVGEKTVFDLRENLRSVMGLFAQQQTIQFIDDLLYLDEASPEKQLLATAPGNTPCLVYADALQVQRVFQNLIKNALQSVPEEREAEIRIKLYRYEKFYGVDVTDNGSGILPENREKIFQPNFTTKSSGMGLGLAIVRKIMEQNAGIIGFETTEGVGTRFYVRFPVYHEQAD
jgi:two-component system, NtrC family, nitrogen regulation sensor histidine kinase NtrY